ncbi:MAG: glycosyltransferase, partial [Aeromicrobium sp.]|nr:glycosyltransferase [Burkholderiales bacterium]
EWVIVAHGPIPTSTLQQLRERSTEAWGATLIIEPKPLGIMGAMQKSLKHAKGDYVVPIDADDLLTVDAIQILVHEIDRLKRPSLIYSDEDLLINGKPEAPYLKPDFDPILNLDSSYIWHLCAINREVAMKLGLYTDTGANWCHDWDTVMRIWNAGGRIEHVAEILYHWRQHPQSTTNQSEGDPRSLQSVRHVLAQQILRTATPERYTVEPWPHFRGMKELYIARNGENLPEFIWVGDVQRDGATRSFDGGEILVVTSGDVVVEGEAVYREVVRLMELHPTVAAVGGRVLDADNRIVEGCLLSKQSCSPVYDWDGRAADDGGSYVLSLKTQSVTATGVSLAFFKLHAIVAIGCEMPNASTELSRWVTDACEKIRRANWQIAFSPLVSARATAGFAPHGRRVLKSADANDTREGINLPVTESTPHFVGTYDPTKNALVSTFGEASYLSYGPYLPLRTGKYVAAFTISASGPVDGELVGVVDVNGFKFSKPENSLGAVDVKVANAEPILHVPFTVDDRNTKFEFRVRVNGGGQVEYKGVRITRIA